jgi:hypothetical protein
MKPIAIPLALSALVSLGWSTAVRADAIATAVAPAAASVAELPAGAEDAVLVVRATNGETVLGQASDRSLALAMGPGGVTRGPSWIDLCEGPCRVRLAAGHYTLRVGHGANFTRRDFHLHPGENRLIADGGNRRLVVAGVLLISAGVFGGALLSTLDSVPVGMLAGGAAVVGGGLMMWSGTPSLEQDREPAHGGFGRPTGVAYRGTF